MRGQQRILGILGLGCALALASAAAVQAQEDDVYQVWMGERSFSAVAAKAYVNPTGGLTVTGTLDCSDEVEAFVDDVEAWLISEGFAGTGDEIEVVLVSRMESTDGDAGWVPVNPRWTAFQYVGRTKVVTASYPSGIAQPCYLEGTPSPYAWQTLYGFPVGQTQWVYSTTGKFGAGSVRIEIDAQGYLGATATVNGQTVMIGDQIVQFYSDLYDFSGWDLRAQKVRS